MPMLDELATYLAAQTTRLAIATGTTGNLAKGANLDEITPNTMVSLYDTQGLQSAFTFSTGAGQPDTAYEQPAFQLLSRSTSYQTAAANAEAAFQIFDGLANQTLPTSTGTRYLSVTAAAPPFFVGRDGNKRILFSVNFTVMKEPDVASGEAGSFSAAFDNAFDNILI